MSRITFILFVALVGIVCRAFAFAPTLFQAYRELSPFLLPNTSDFPNYCATMDEEITFALTNNSTRFFTTEAIPSYFRRYLKESF
uniref:BTB domain-containing protein n=1 Tax=Panagrellus redivivus TaxID=6233 RepID=A0A7E4WB14_PANRE